MHAQAKTRSIYAQFTAPRKNIQGLPEESDILNYVASDRVTFTVENLETGAAYTYRSIELATQRILPGSRKERGFYVYLTEGPDSPSDPVCIGKLWLKSPCAPALSPRLRFYPNRLHKKTPSAYALSRFVDSIHSEGSVFHI